MKLPAAILSSLLLLAGAAVAFDITPEKKEEAPAAKEPPSLEQALGLTMQKGPATGDLGAEAGIAVPEGYQFTGGEGTIRILEAMQNPTSGKELGFIGPVGGDWFVVFDFNDSGYVKDDEKDTLDADAILASLQEGSKRSNEVRKERGWPTMDITGWELPPRYNPETHNLEWAFRYASQGHTGVNHNTRILGRKGVMQVTLVAGPDELPAVMPAFKALMSGFQYKEGNRYAEYKEGDKLAAYGLSALVVGGAAAVAAKAGLFKWLWKLLAVGGVAIAGFVGRFFGRKKEA